MTRAWPRSKEYAARFLVEDLVPAKTKNLRAVFIAESPHKDEVKPEKPAERTPFRGSAGRDWWLELGAIIGHEVETGARMASRKELLELCEEAGIAVMNAVRFPIDPKIEKHYAGFVPFEGLGFQKGAGARGFKSIFKKGDRKPVAAAIDELARRLAKIQDADAQLVSLGVDSEWFVSEALKQLPEEAPLRKNGLLRISHPSHWKYGAQFRAKAVSQLKELLRGGGARRHAG